jgi:hypothetical protein
MAARHGRAKIPLMRVLRLWPLLVAAGCAPASHLPPGDYRPREPHDTVALPPDRLAALREDALRRARVWQEPAVPVEKADLAVNPQGPGALRPDEVIVCRYHYNVSSGYAPKFRCVRDGGDLLKVKYGRNSREVRTEVASTRLLAALGFGADRMYVVDRVRCYGCPPYPHEKLGLFNALRADYDDYRDFDMASVERKLPGRVLETPDRPGWRWDELSRIDPARGGSTRAEVDALRLMAVFLANWDLKEANQRLVCLSGPEGEPEDACARPLAYMQDVGTTFGPHSMNLDTWSSRPVWADPATCLVSMKGLPFDGAGFGEVYISEEGRRFLADRLSAISPPQLEALFLGARFHDFPYADSGDRDVGRWVATFQARVRQVADRPPCPSS